MSDNVPQIRFKDYTTPWETCKLSDLFDKAISNNTLSRADLNYENGEVKNIHYGDILVKFGTFVDPTKDNVPFISNGKADDYEGKLLRDGDIVFADAAEDITVGKMVEVINENEINIVSGLHTIAYRPNKTMPSYFWGYYMNSNAYRRQLLPLMQGIKVLSLSRTNLSKTAIRYPCTTQEQTAIGNFFKTLDALTSLQTNKLEKLKTLKRAYLQQLFPQEEETTPRLRFADFDGEWVQCKLGEVGKTQSGIGFPEKDQHGTEGTPFFKVSDMNLCGNQNVMNTANNYVSDEQIRQKKWKIINDIPAIIFAKVGAALLLDRKRIVFTPFLIDNNMMAYLLSNKWDIDFAKTKFDTMNLSKYAQIGALPSFNSAEVEAIEILLPFKTEQIIIGNFFKSLDKNITAQRNKLDKLKQLKAAYLQKMFV